MSNFIAYYRVSTTRQGQSGLGLDAQRTAVKNFLLNRGWPPLQEFTEVESGRNNSRPELMRALLACRLHNARLVIAKLDRLARNAAFLLNLRDSGVEFVAVDMPEANRLTIGIMALVAEDEAERISQRTKAALREAKRRGTKLGNPQNLSNQMEGTKRSAEVRKLSSTLFAKDIMSVVEELTREGVTTLAGLANKLTQKQIPTPRGKAIWNPMQVKRVMETVKGLTNV